MHFWVAGVLKFFVVYEKVCMWIAPPTEVRNCPLLFSSVCIQLCSLLTNCHIFLWECFRPTRAQRKMWYQSSGRSKIMSNWFANGTRVNLRPALVGCSFLGSSDWDLRLFLAYPYDLWLYTFCIWFKVRIAVVHIDLLHHNAILPKAIQLYLSIFFI